MDDMAAMLPAYDTFLDYLVEKATPQEILAFAVSEEQQERATELLTRQNEGTINPDEQAEMQRMEEVDRLVSVLKAKAAAAMKRA
jgi:methylase of polypeptide subunit release factors